MRHQVIAIAFALFTVVSSFCLGQAESAAPTNRLITAGPDKDGVVRAIVDKSLMLRTSRQFKRVTVGSPDIADVSPVTPTQILVTGKKPGSTNLTVWDDQDQFEMVNIEVRRADGGNSPDTGAAGNDASVQRSALPGFIQYNSKRAVVHVNVNQIAAIIVAPVKAPTAGGAPTTTSAETVTRIVLTGGGDNDLPHSLDVSSKVMKADEVIEIVRQARESAQVTSPEIRVPSGR